MKDNDGKSSKKYFSKRTTKKNLISRDSNKKKVSYNTKKSENPKRYQEKKISKNKTIVINKLKNNDIQMLAKELTQGKIIIMKTDTIYGIIASSRDIQAVKRVFKIKKRNYDQPFIQLINSFDMLKDLVKVQERKIPDIVKSRWPGPTTFVMQAAQNLNTILKKNNRVAVRWPNDKNLLDLINNVKTPLIAPSANIHGSNVIININEIKRIFDGQVDFIISSGNLKNQKPSTIIDVSRKPYSVLR